MSGLFSTFNVAKRGMSVQQKALDVTSHNIANANTQGYSRQRAKIETTKPFGMPSINSVAEPGQLGTGAQISAIERIRDTFLDYQVRAESSTFGHYNTRNNFLSEIENIFNEPSDTGMTTLMTKFYNSWQELSKKANDSNARTVVAEQSAALAEAFNQSFRQLTKLKENAQNLIKSNVFDANNILNQIDQLNQQIMGVKVAGNMPNDLMDKRDVLLDELSVKFGIEIDRRSFEGLDVNPSDSTVAGHMSLVKAVQNQENVYRFSYVSSIDKVDDATAPPTYKVTYFKLGNSASGENTETLYVQMTDDQKKQLDEGRIIAGKWGDATSSNNGMAIDKDGNILSSSATAPISFDELVTFSPSNGDFKGLISIQKDVNGYIQQINKLAKALAWSVNAIHGYTEDAAAFKPLDFFVNKDNVAGGENEITAENISVNPDILKDVMKIYVHATPNSGETDGPRALAIAQLRDSLLKIQDIGVTINSKDEFIGGAGSPHKLKDKGLGLTNDITGTKIDNYFKDTIDRLGVQAQEAKRMVKNQLNLLDSFQESRMSVSGVSLDEEMANMIQFNHAYQANAKIIATIDELLDVVVNGLKR